MPTGDGTENGSTWLVRVYPAFAVTVGRSADSRMATPACAALSRARASAIRWLVSTAFDSASSRVSRSVGGPWAATLPTTPIVSAAVIR